MTDYTKLVKALRCKRDDCEGCDIAFFDKDEGWMCRYAAKDDDAAAAIEELDAEETRLLMITSELQDKVVELEEELNDADVAADDNARQIEELQSEVDTLKRTDSKRCQECLYLGQPVGEQQLPKRGEWQKAKPKGVVTYSDGYAECSHCHEAIWLGWGMNFCPNCGTQNRIIDPDDYDGAKTEVQDGQRT